MEAVSFIKDNITKEMVKNYLLENGANGLIPDGDKYRCSCPIHNGDNATAFVYNPDGHLWVCHTECGGGDIFTLIAHMNNLEIEKEFPKVVDLTAKEFGINIDGLNIGEIKDSYKSDMLKWFQYELNRKEVFNAPYDISRLGPKFSINSYRGFNKEILDKFGVYYSQDFNRILFTIYNENGIEIGASLRATGDEKPKWVHQPKSIKTGEVLYNLNNIKGKFKEVYIVEGMIDVINLNKIGIENVVCSFGSNLTRKQVYLLMNYFESIILFFDNDKAGKKAIRKSIEKYNKMINIDVMLLEDINDPGEIKTLEDFRAINRIRWYNYKEE